MTANESPPGRPATELSTAAVLTPPGRGAVATVSIQGPLVQVAAAIDLHFSAANDRTFQEQSVGRVCFGHWGRKSGADSGENPSEAVVLSRRNEFHVEVCCHGGPAATEQILSDLRKSGIPSVPWQDHGADSPETLASEFDMAVLSAATRRAVMTLLEQKRVLSGQVTHWMMQAGSGDDWADSVGAQIDRCLQWSECGLHLTTPWRVVLAGRPNVGKSSLLNALAGFSRAIVNQEPGTTRDVVSVETAFDGWSVLLADTAGLRETSDEIEQEGVSRSRQAMDEADCVCLLFDSASALTALDRQLLADAEVSMTPTVSVASRSDLGTENHPGCLEVSAVTGSGLEDLMAAIVRQLVPQEPPVQQAIPVTVRQVRLLTAAREAAGRSDRETLLAILKELISGPDFQA